MKRNQTTQDTPLTDDVYDVVIIGGGPAGISAAIYAGRKNMKALIITDALRGQSAASGVIQNWIGERQITGLELAKKLEEHLKYCSEVSIRMRETVQKIERDVATNIFSIRTQKEIYNSRTVIIATGASHKKLGIPGEDAFAHKGISYCSVCDAPLCKAKRVAIIGGGNVAVQAAYDTAPFASEIYLLEQASELSADALPISHLKDLPIVPQVILNAKTVEIVGAENVTGLRYTDTETGTEQVLQADKIFIAVGSTANSSIGGDLVKLNDASEMIVDLQSGQTSCEGIFAAGDVTNSVHKQNNIAAGDGIRAALSAYLYIHTH